MQEFYVNAETCSLCGNCIDVCPTLLLEKDNSGTVCFKTDNAHLCIRCGQCMAVCNTKSVFASGMNYEKDFFEFSNENDFFSLLEHRRSVRSFKPKPVNEEEINKILHAVSMAPHGDSHQHVEVTVINNREKIMEAMPYFEDFYNKLEKWLHNPIMCNMIKIKKGQDTLNTLKNHLLPRIKKGIYRNAGFDYDGITRGSHSLLLFHAHEDSEEHKEDAYIFVTYAMLAAQALGLGSTIVGMVPPAINKSEELKKKFHIPSDHETVISLIVGYPKHKYKRGIKRELKKVNWIN